VKPGRAPIDINSPDLPGLALQAQRLGVPITQLLEVLKAQQPDVGVGPDGSTYNKKSLNGIPQRFATPQNINGWNIDQGDPKNRGGYFPKLPDGMIPDGKGGLVNATGLTAAQQAQEEASTLGRTRGSMLTVPTRSGAPAVMTGAQYLGGEGGAGGAQALGAGVGQTPDDAAYRAEGAKTAAATYKALQDAGQRAQGSITRYTRIGSLLDGLNTGRLTPTGLEIAKTASALGYKVNPKYGNLEAADALSNAIVLDVMGGSLGAGFSNADRDFAKSMSPAMTQTPQGRKLVVEYGIAKAKREQDIAGKARAWQQRFGRIDAADATGKTFQDYLEAWGEAHPMFPPPK
jgi:hypothetical protein